MMMSGRADSAGQPGTGVAGVYRSATVRCGMTAWMIAAVAGLGFVAAPAFADEPAPAPAPTAAAAAIEPAAPAAVTIGTDWLDTYYLHPDPDQIETFMAYLQKEGLLLKKNAIPMEAGFFSRVFAANPTRVAGWAKATEAYSEAERMVFIMALSWSDVPEADEVLTAWGKGQGNFSQISLMAKLKEAPALGTLENPTPSEVAACAGAFFATGDASYIETLLRAVARPQAEGPSEQARSDASIFFVTHYGRQEAVMRIRDAFYAKATPAQKTALDELAERAKKIPAQFQ